MTTPLTLTPGRRADGTTLLTAVGEIDMSNTDALAAALDTAPGPVVLDLTEVGYLDSAGLNVLFSHADRMELITGPLLAPVLTVSGLADLTTVRERPGDAASDGPDPGPPVPPEEWQ
ncbi:STAS domain-containing protein [Streptomyces sp. DH12]|uniref:STAS domain-containing protein n=1 Tax=Streptomyces sp. DH12 TaxID=2857010 RepID=UPI001E5F2F66|nr:STAS domain-containing protein [Streptomyces sp. DH12]